MGNIDGHAFTTQAASHGLGERDLVLDHQHSHDRTLAEVMCCSCE
jgi:hypothetical protein